MLQAFFQIGQDHKNIFAGLDISRESDLCLEYMNKYPVIFLTLKSVEGKDFAGALEQMGVQVSNECKRLSCFTPIMIKR